MGKQVLCGLACFLLFPLTFFGQTTEPVLLSAFPAEFNSSESAILNALLIIHGDNGHSVTGNRETVEKPLGSLEVTTAGDADQSIILIDEKDSSKILTAKHKDVLEKQNETEKAGEELFMPAMEDDIDTLISKYAEMIAMDPVELNNHPLYKFIDKWYGTRYKYGGTDNGGIDCSAFSQRLYHDIYKLELLRTARQQHRHCERIRHLEDATEGDLIFFRIHRLRISHVGIYLANGYFVHASSTHGVTISSLNDKYWGRRYAGCGRIDREDNTVSESDFTPPMPN